MEPGNWEYTDSRSSTHVNISVFEGRLGEIEASSLQCDCIVSPANSYGIMDGGYILSFDLELSRVLKGKKGDDWTLTDHCQTFIRRRSGGYLPPGSCTIVPLPETASGLSENPWHAHSLAILPTMREPEDISWNRDLVYNAMWSLLNEVAGWNERYGHGGG
ncbi:hypothetical protein BDZ97DRAFT_1753235 [Flammula alnicola]|nr:hypothetical protein BDZ97DRAFT_1753235 [Flammula alnicola]